MYKSNNNNNFYLWFYITSFGMEKVDFKMSCSADLVTKTNDMVSNIKKSCPGQPREPRRAAGPRAAGRPPSIVASLRPAILAASKARYQAVLYY